MMKRGSLSDAAFTYNEHGAEARVAFGEKSSSRKRTFRSGNVAWRAWRLNYSFSSMHGTRAVRISGNVINGVKRRE